MNNYLSTSKLTIHIIPNSLLQEKEKKKNCIKDLNVERVGGKNTPVESFTMYDKD